MVEVNRAARRRFIARGAAAVTAAVAARRSASAEDRKQSPPGKPTYLVIYRPGVAWKTGTPISALPLKEHGQYMMELYEKGAMRSAGPFADDSGAAVVLEADDEASARSLVEADPAVSAEIFRFELHRWNVVPWDEIARRRAVSRP